MNKTNNSVKQDVEKFLRRVQLKAFFHYKGDDSNTSRRFRLENRSGLPQTASLPLYIFSSINAVMK